MKGLISRFAAPAAISILSGVLLQAAFPKLGFHFLVWVALAPLLLAATGKRLTEGFLLFLLCGISFFLGIFDWILEVPEYKTIHHSILAVYLGSYFGCFGLAFCFIARQWGFTPAFLSAPFMWVSLEYLRSNMSFMALPWGLLAHSQYEQTCLIQTASWGGVYSVSFLIMLVNVAVAALLFPLIYKTENRLGHNFQKKQRATVISLVAVVFASALLFGLIKTSSPSRGERFAISIIQGNTDQREKWDPRYARAIMQTYAELTQKASSDNPALIVWPETAVPGALNHNPQLQQEVRNIAKRIRVPLLIGSAQHQKLGQKRQDQSEYLNSAYLIAPHEENRREKRYDKILLFPFGEYLPMKTLLPWSFINVPDPGGYASGKEFTVFELSNYRFSSTICWENLFPDLVRQFVANGAQFIVNMTNEAWFGKTAAPYQFLSMNVFRAVENRVPVIRCANTGISCFIDAYGRVVGRVENNGEDIFVQGHLTKKIHISQEKTLYTLYGDWFAYTCIIVSFSFIIFSIIRAVRGRARPSGLSR